MREVAGDDKVRGMMENVLGKRVALVRCRRGRTCSSMWFVARVKRTAVGKLKIWKVLDACYPSSLRFLRLASCVTSSWVVKIHALCPLQVVRSWTLWEFKFQSRCEGDQQTSWHAFVQVVHDYVGCSSVCWIRANTTRIMSLYWSDFKPFHLALGVSAETYVSGKQCKADPTSSGTSVAHFTCFHQGLHRTQGIVKYSHLLHSSANLAKFNIL